MTKAGNHKSGVNDVAIVGMACRFPGATDIQTYWENIVSGQSAIADAPHDWEGLSSYDPDSTANDRTYCKRGGFLGQLSFVPASFGVMPVAVAGADPDHFVGLMLASEALKDAGYPNGTSDPARTEIIVGRGTYINRAFTNQLQHCFVIDQTLRLLQELHPEYTSERLMTIKARMKASLPPFNADVAPGLVPNVLTGRIAGRFNLMGSNFTVDAACASSLVAIEIVMRDLILGKCDLALAGGANVSTSAPTYMLFCQLGALSRRGEIRPFDKGADGTLLGEGFGMIAMKRRADAEKDGDRIYAVLKAVGIASDGAGTGVLAPSVRGQSLAISRAYGDTTALPESVGLLEAHGTGTPVGDRVEIAALSGVFCGPDTRAGSCVLGSVKSMIGHLMPAAGMAGVIKASLALFHKVLPPTLNCDRPINGVAGTSPFYVTKEAQSWIHGVRTPRRAGVNAFGFGGINAHAVLEESGE